MGSTREKNKARRKRKLIKEDVNYVLESEKLSTVEKVICKMIVF